jgi:energy-coupling factor transporter transmembrane protein EcfT
MCRLPGGLKMMAASTTFAYQTGSTFLHRLDVRFKLIMLTLFTLASMHAEFVAVFGLACFFICLGFHIRLPFKTAAMEARLFLVLLTVILAFRATSTPGQAVIDIGIVSVTCEGLYAGFMLCLQLVVIMLTGLLFIATTRPAKIKGALEYLLRPLPCIPEKRVAVIMSLMVRFIPVILGQARDTMDAQKARGIENRKNPVYRLVKLALPLGRRTFETADKLSLAMSARCYSENRTPPSFSATRKDWMMLFAVICVCFLMVGW